MNRTKIEWTDYTWNPITGCLHNCWYCYAKKMFTRFHRSFEPTFHPERLNELEKLKKPSKIFVCSVADLFAEWTKSEWVLQVLMEMKKYPQHIYQLLTKQPQNIAKEINFGDNVWIGTTVTKQTECVNIEEILQVQSGVRFVSFEPLLEEINCDLEGLDWIIVGKLTGSKKIPLQKEWVEKLIKQARELKTPIFIKNNVNWVEKIQEFPNTNGDLR
jgi:protein gp37